MKAEIGKLPEGGVQTWFFPASACCAVPPGLPTGSHHRVLLLNRICTCMLSHAVVSDSLQPHGRLAHQAPQSMEFSRQECWSRVPFPAPGNRSDPGTETTPPALQTDSSPVGHLESPGGFTKSLLREHLGATVQVSVSAPGSVCPS